MGAKLPAAVPLSQVAKLGSLLLLFLLAPLVPSFLRVPYFYLLFNVIVLGLGIQAGLLGGISGVTSFAPRADETQHRSSSDQHISSCDQHRPSSDQADTPISIAASPFQRARSLQPNVVEQKAVEHDRVPVVSPFAAIDIVELKTKTKEVVLTLLLKKCPSAASIFFLSALNGGQALVGGEEQAYQEEKEDCNQVDGDGDVTMSRQELFANTERFIGMFRKQLRMERQRH